MFQVAYLLSLTFALLHKESKKSELDLLLLSLFSHSADSASTKCTYINVNVCAQRVCSSVTD